MKKSVKVVLSIAVIVIFIIRLRELPSDHESDCNAAKDFQNLTFYGIISKAFEDKEDHTRPKVEIWDIKLNRKIIFDVLGERTRLFFRLNQGDTIEKQANSFKVIRHSKTGGIYTADFNCPEIQNKPK